MRLLRYIGEGIEATAYIAWLIGRYVVYQLLYIAPLTGLAVMLQQLNERTP